MVALKRGGGGGRPAGRSASKILWCRRPARDGGNVRKSGADSRSSDIKYGRCDRRAGTTGAARSHASCALAQGNLARGAWNYLGRTDRTLSILAGSPQLALDRRLLWWRAVAGSHASNFPPKVAPAQSGHVSLVLRRGGGGQALRERVNLEEQSTSSFEAHIPRAQLDSKLT